MQFEVQTLSQSAIYHKCHSLDFIASCSPSIPQLYPLLANSLFSLFSSREGFQARLARHPNCQRKTTFDKIITYRIYDPQNAVGKRILQKHQKHLSPISIHDKLIEMLQLILYGTHLSFINNKAAFYSSIQYK